MASVKTVPVDTLVIDRFAARRSSRRAVVQLGIGMLIILGALAFLAFQGLTHDLVYYITPSELLAKGASGEGQQLTLGGQVRPGSIRYNKTTKELQFVLQDPKGHVAVMSYGLPPTLFAPGIGAVVQGVYRKSVFHASQLMIKHSSTYVAPKPGQLPKNDNYVTK